MSDLTAAPTLVVGLGCQRGCPEADLRALFDQTLRDHGIELRRVKALASIDLKSREPGLLALATALSLPLVCFSKQQLGPYTGQLSHRSQVAFEHTGCYGVAESAALALAEQLSQGAAKLLVTRQKSLQATLALACSA